MRWLRSSACSLRRSNAPATKRPSAWRKPRRRSGARWRSERRVVIVSAWCCRCLRQSERGPRQRPKLSDRKSESRLVNKKSTAACARAWVRRSAVTHRFALLPERPRADSLRTRLGGMSGWQGGPLKPRPARPTRCNRRVSRLHGVSVCWRRSGRVCRLAHGRWRRQRRQ